MEIHIEDLPVREQDTSPGIDQAVEPTEHLAIASHFNIDTPTKEEAKKLMTIWEYARTMSKTGETMDIIWQVKHAGMTLGAPRLGESPLDKLYRWAKLKRQESQIQEELKYV